MTHLKLPTIFFLLFTFHSAFAMYNPLQSLQSKSKVISKATKGPHESHSQDTAKVHHLHGPFSASPFVTRSHPTFDSGFGSEQDFTKTRTSTVTTHLNHAARSIGDLAGALGGDLTAADSFTGSSSGLSTAYTRPNPHHFNTASDSKVLTSRASDPSTQAAFTSSSTSNLDSSSTDPAAATNDVLPTPFFYTPLLSYTTIFNDGTPTISAITISSLPPPTATSTAAATTPTSPSDALPTPFLFTPLLSFTTILTDGTSTISAITVSSLSLVNTPSLLPATITTTNSVPASSSDTEMLMATPTVSDYTNAAGLITLTIPVEATQVGATEMSTLTTVVTRG